jgi:hypothetical protein
MFQLSLNWNIQFLLYIQKYRNVEKKGIVDDLRTCNKKYIDRVSTKLTNSIHQTAHPV